MNPRALLPPLLAAALLPAAVADAGTYHVTACADAPAGQTSAFTAQPNTSPATITASIACPPAAGQAFSGLLIADTLGTPNSPNGASAGWTITAVPGTTLAALRVRRYLGKRYPDWNVAVRAADGSVLDTCEYDPNLLSQCANGSSTPTSPDDNAIYDHLDTSSVSFTVACQAGPFTCTNSVGQHQAWIVVYSATATVSDPDPPTVSAPDGPLVSGGWQHATGQTTVAASDASGVQATGLQLDGHALDPHSFACDYTQMRPCQPSANDTFSVDLTAIPDGTHELRATATDAAGQQATSAPGTLRVDKHAPTAPVGLTATRNPDGTYTATWTNPDQWTAAPVTAARYAVCAPASTSDCPTGELIPGQGIDRLNAIGVPSGGGPYDLRVWLQDEAGNTDPSDAAVLTINTSTDANTDPGTTTNPDPGTNPGPGTDPGHDKPLPGGKPTLSAKLRALTARRTANAATLTITGTTTPHATGIVSAQLATGRKTRPLLTADTHVTKGHWRIRIHLTRAERRRDPRYLTVRYLGDAKHLAAMTQRKLVLKKTKKRLDANAARGFNFERPR